jgi:hypothetical protein
MGNIFNDPLAASVRRERALRFDLNGHDSRSIALPKITLPPNIEREDWMADLVDRPWIMGESIWTCQRGHLRDD